MRNPRLILYIALALAVFFEIRREDAAPAMPMVAAAYPYCGLNAGPVERPDHYSTRPHGRRKDVA